MDGYRVALTKTSNSGRTQCVPPQRSCGQRRWDMGDMGKELFAQRWLWKKPGSCSSTLTSRRVQPVHDAVSRRKYVCNLSSRVSNWARILRNFHCGQLRCPKSMLPSSGVPLAICGPVSTKTLSLLPQALVSSQASHIKRPRCPQSPVSSLLPTQPNTALRLHS